jgi:type 1 glutamine amidotransferase
LEISLTIARPGRQEGVAAWRGLAYRKSPVCYVQLGHYQHAYGNPQFATILGRAIRWTAGRRPPDSK